MRRHFVTQAVRRRSLDRRGPLFSRLHLLVEMAQLRLQERELLLLTKNRPVKFLDQIFHQTAADFEFSDSIIHGRAYSLSHDVPPSNKPATRECAVRRPRSWPECSPTTQGARNDDQRPHLAVLAKLTARR